MYKLQDGANNNTDAVLAVSTNTSGKRHAYIITIPHQGVSKTELLLGFINSLDSLLPDSNYNKAMILGCDLDSALLQ